jgi:hypothetical protein
MGGIRGLDTKLRRWSLLSATGVALVVACTGKIGPTGDGPAGARPGDPNFPGLGSGGGGGGGSQTPMDPARDPGKAGYGDAGAEGLTDRPAPATRYARLTHAQWANAVHDLLGIDGTAELTESFRSDPAPQGFLFENNEAALEVDDALWSNYQRAAGDVATRVTGDAGVLASLVAGASADAQGARTFVTNFGQKVHRRPLTPAQVDAYMSLYSGAAGTYPGMSDHEAGIRLVLEAFLQSPYFLYRIESSATKSGDVIPLDGWEIASRLSFMLWNTMPDPELFRAAAAGELSRADAVASQAERLLADDRAADVIASFHAQLFNVEHYSVIAPLDSLFPDAPDDLDELARSETDLFVRSIVDSGGGFSNLLTSTQSFVNADLARIYGLSGSFSDTLTETTLNAGQRKGLLTQVGFLASNSTSVNPDPIHRGVFVAKRILCTKIAAPPANVPPLPPAEGRTNRQTVEDHTQQEDTVCITCHGSIINPLGFPFESYDATGAWRTTDANQPVNTVSDARVGTESVHVAGALDLIDAIAESDAAHACYARHWLEFAYGRPSVRVDDSLIDRLGADSKAGTLSIKQMVLGLVKTEAFLTRSVEELP